ncbi:MAG: Cys-tRNA(Pro) deacylase [Pseudomonadota bacterium]
MSKHTDTPATTMLKMHGVPYAEHVYDYVEHGGTNVSSSSLGVDEHHVVKTLIFEDDKRQPLCVLMHGDRKVSTKELARQTGAKRVAPCKPEDAFRHSGYMVGGCSPFGLRKPMPVCLQKSILDIEKIYINGGKRGFLVSMSPHDVVRVIRPTLVDACLIEI